jgi:hypothetical protein
MNEERDLLLNAFMSEMFAPTEDDVDTAIELTHPVGAFFQKAFEPLDDPAWDEEIGVPLVKLSNGFRARSDARLERVAEKIRTIFRER